MAEENEQPIQRDFVFFVSGIPPDIYVHHPQRALVAIGSDQKAVIKQIAEKQNSHAISNWMRGAGDGYCAAILRNEFADEKDAFSDSFEKLSGIVDGYAFLLETNAPEISPLVLIRKKSEKDAVIKNFGSRGWISWDLQAGSPEGPLQGRRSKLLQRFLTFFEAASSDAKHFDTELVNQVSLSAKMFRHGCKSESYGIEFLCKFTALEGLVCGPVEHGHGRLLKDRLSCLFRGRSSIVNDVAKLWKRRCEASHQGKAFSNEFSSLIGTVDEFMLGVFVFALDNLPAAQTIDQLWIKAAAYTVPAEIKRGYSRLPIIHMESTIGCWPGCGVFTDAVFEQVSNTRKPN